MSQNTFPSSTALDLENSVIKLCIEGTQAEFQGRKQDAAALFAQAWQIAKDDYEACIAAHYVAHLQANPLDALRWDQTALLHADAVKDGRVQDFYPSLYLSLGHSHELIGQHPEAQKYYAMAAALGVIHQNE